MAKNVCDVLNGSFYTTSPDVEDFRPALVANCVFNSFLSYTNIFLNIITIHAIRKTALLPKPLRTLLLSLAASDVGVGLLAQPLYISTLVSWLKQKHIDRIFYRGLLAVITFFCISSLLNVVTISVDRFLAVHLHLRYQERVTRKRVIAAVISIWLLSAIISSLQGTSADVTKSVPKSRKHSNHGSVPSSQSVVWGEQHQKAIETLLDHLVSPPLLDYPDFSKPFVLHTDACQKGLLGLYQKQNGKMLVIGYGSRSLTKAVKSSLP